MTRTTCCAVITLFFLLTGSLQSPAQNKKIQVTGSVVDATTMMPLPDVNISIVGTSGGGTTNQAGEFSLNLTRIPSILYFNYVGYSISSYQVDKSNERNIRVLLEPETKEIEEVRIRAERVSKVIRGDTLNVVDYEID
ncbi:MAG: carboxypeptidase-like regulatory domain-containing protein, partial [Bacteroidales bacterium]